MEERDDKNPHAGNIHQEFNFHGNVQNVNPAAHTVNNTYYIYKGVQSDEDQNTTTSVSSNEANLIDKGHLRGEILEYVGRLYDLYKPEWQMHYPELWNDILDIPEIDSEVYKRGRQRDTHFNRNLVANIIYYLDGHHLYRDEYRATEFTRALEKGDKDSSVRASLGMSPSSAICEAIRHLIETKKYL